MTDSLDLGKGYRQMPMAEQDIQKTPDGEYELLKMPLGMTNSGATFVRCMRKLSRLENVELYVDDILLHTRDCMRRLLCDVRNGAKAG